MGQLLFFSIFFIALLSGIFAYFAPSQKPINPVKFMMESSGYDSEENYNRKRVQQFNITMNKGLLKIRREMDRLSVIQDKFLDAIKDQQRVLKSAGKDAQEVMLEAKNSGSLADRDILHLQALSAQMQDQQRLLVSHGDDLIVLNDQLKQERQWISDQIDLDKIDSEDSFNSLQQRYLSLKNQTSGFIDQVNQQSQQLRDRMDKIHSQMYGVSNNVQSGQSLKDHIERMLDKQKDDLSRIAQVVEKNKESLIDLQQNNQNSKDSLNDTKQRNKDLVDQEKQKIEFQNEMNKQRIADQMRRAQDQKMK